MLVIRGARSEIAKAFTAIVRDAWPRESIVNALRDAPIPIHGDRYLFCNGLLHPKRFVEQTPLERAESWSANFASIARDCQILIQQNENARICVIGTESVFHPCFDDGYAGAKAALHRFVEHTRLLSPRQQLVGVSPTIIEDSAMTRARTDQENVRRRAAEHPKGRWLTAAEVARTAYFLLYVDAGYTTGTMVRMHGGQP